MEKTREELREEKIQTAMAKVRMTIDKMIADARRAEQALDCDESLSDKERKEIVETLERFVGFIEKGVVRFDATFRGKVEAAAKAAQEAEA